MLAQGVWAKSRPLFSGHSRNCIGGQGTDPTGGVGQFPGLSWGAFETRPVNTSQARQLLPFGHRLTPNFSLGELALNRPERRFQHDWQVETALQLLQFAEQIRATFGGPVVITSGFRPWAINLAVGGARFSEHLYSRPGEGAIDFYLTNGRTLDAERWAAARWPYSLGLAASRKGFIHLGRRADGGRYRWNY